MELTANKSLIGRTFKADARAINEALDKFQPEEISAVEKSLVTDGLVSFFMFIQNKSHPQICFKSVCKMLFEKYWFVILCNYQASYLNFVYINASFFMHEKQSICDLYYCAKS